MPGSPPPPHPPLSENPWEPYNSKLQFQTADLLFCKIEMSSGFIDELLELWGESLEQCGEPGPFGLHEQMYATIDSTKHGDIPWKCMAAEFAGEITGDLPSWKKDVHEIWYRDVDAVIAQMLSNPDFKEQFDYVPYIGLDKKGDRHWSDFMSGNYAWRHSVRFVLYPGYVWILLTALFTDSNLQ